MNYNDWSKEYQMEAENVLKHIAVIRKELKTAKPIRANEIRSRIALLYQIYYELKSTSNDILEYANKED